MSKEPTKHSTRADRAVSRFKGAPQQRRVGEKKRVVEMRIFILFSFELICQVTSNLYHIAERHATTKCNFLFIFCLGGLESEKSGRMTILSETSDSTSD